MGNDYQSIDIQTLHDLEHEKLPVYHQVDSKRPAHVSPTQVTHESLPLRLPGKALHLMVNLYSHPFPFEGMHAPFALYFRCLVPGQALVGVSYMPAMKIKLVRSST